MTDQQAVLLIIGGAVLFAAAIIAVVARGSSALGAGLLALTTSFGWEGPHRICWSGAIRGRWRGIDVELRHMNRYKGTPERLLLTMKTTSPARLILKHRVAGFFSKPITWFGPPLVEPMNIADRERYGVRSDELVYVERLFARGEVAPALEPNLIARFDVVDLQPKQLRILRAIDDRAVKKHFNRPFIKFGRDLELIETIAAAEWTLAVVIVEALALRGYEAS